MTDSLSDSYIFNEALDRPMSEKPFQEKQRLWLQDQATGGIYNGTVQYDLSPWANNGMYTDYSNAVLEIPYLVSIKGDTTRFTGCFDKDSLSLKAGFWNLIDQLQVDVNNKTVCQLSQNINVLANVRALTSFDITTYEKMGSVLGLVADTETSYTYAATSSVNGDGYCNNSSSNDGFQIRKAFMANAAELGFADGTADIDELPTVIGSTANASAAIKASNAAAVYGSEGRPYFTTTTSGSDTIFNYVYICSIRLRDLSDFFLIPISRGLQIRLTINYNSFRGTYNAVTSTGLLSTTSYTQLSGSTCPVLLAPLKTAPATTGTFEVAGNIVSNSLSSSPTPAISSTRLYIDCYKLNADYQSALLKNMPLTTHKYFDYYSYSIPSVQPNGTFNQIVSNGIPSLRAVFVLAYSTPSSSIAAGTTDWQNIFNSAPFTTLPSAPLENFNILVGGRTQLMNNQTFSYENYLSELIHMFSIHGGNANAINSGLIDKTMFDNCYRIYTVWIRGSSIEDSIPKSLQVTGTNASKVPVSYTVLALFEKSISLNTATGEIVATIP